ncbi:sensor histidine kinase [Nonomuraea sp. NPDC003804]|uniref:sensor histidine kinase n=1 Tax=Nonomuraea sp. NPDC003804 TaxID=3154547 RepID=UPI0033BB1633
MRDRTPRPPLWARLPRGVRTLVVWCGLAGLVPLLYVMTLTDGEDLLPVAASHAAFAVAMAVPLAWARRSPEAVLAVLLAGAIGAAVLGQPVQRWWPLFPAADVLVCLLTATRSRRAGLVAAAATLIVQETTWQADLLRHGLRAWAPGFLALSFLLGLGVLIAWLAGVVVRQRRAYDLALRAHAGAQAVTEERLRIARELHDLVAHSIGIIAIQAGAGARVIDTRPEQARQALGAIEDTSRQTLKGLRQMVGVLRETDREHPGSPEHGPGAGLADVDRLARTTTAAGVRVDVRRHGRPRLLPAAVDRSAFRIVQESVTNVLRHADAGHCRVLIDYGSEDVRIDIVDDGRGAASPAAGEGSGHGIAGMRERVALLNGDFSAGPRPEGGFRVTARLPLTTAAEPAIVRARAEAGRTEAR